MPSIPWDFAKFYTVNTSAKSSGVTGDNIDFILTL